MRVWVSTKMSWGCVGLLSNVLRMLSGLHVVVIINYELLLWAVFIVIINPCLLFISPRSFVAPFLRCAEKTTWVDWPTQILDFSIKI